MKKSIIFMVWMLSLAGVNTAQASSEHPLADVKIVQTPETLKKGAGVATSVCIACHNLKYLRYRDLLNVGFTRGEVDVIRGEHGMFDHLEALTPPDMAVSIYGLVPPDLSLIAKAREGNGRHVYSLVTGFYKEPDGKVNNHFIPNVRMPDILGFAEMTNDEERKEVQEKVKDVAAFLEWAADPKAQERRHLGYFVIGYLIIFTLLLYLLKKRIWSRLPH